MRNVLSALVLFGLLACAAPSAGARCGDRPGDREAVDSALGAIIGQCGCCRPRVPPRPSRTACPGRVVASFVDAGALPRRCASTVLRLVRRTCRASLRIGVPCPPATTTTTLPRPTCGADADCDDGNGCTADACVRGHCLHQCRCVGPGGGVSCCPGPAAACDSLRFYYTCGDPVCFVDPQPIPGIPACTTEKAGDRCAVSGAECDPGVGCGVRLRCTDHDPTARSCPISQRRVKRDIRYLTAGDAERLRDELLRLPLATYRYRSEGAAASSRLGFVIDDVGESPAVAPGGTMVDVYGYATMAVAAIQAQQREIARLGREMDALRRECRSRVTPRPH